MFPVLFEIPLFGGLRIYTYGVLVAAAFLAGILWTTHEAKLKGVSKERILDLTFYIILAALIGSRVLYILISWDQYAQNPLAVLKIWEGGLVFYGGLLGAIAVMLIYLRRHKMGFLPVADLYAPGLALGHAIGRLGCFAAGCCHGGAASDFPLAIHFPDIPYSLAPTGIPLYPTQIMESLAAFLIFLFLVWFRKNHRGTFTGQIFSLYLLFYGIARTGLEIFRGEHARTNLIFYWLSVSQLISLLLILSALIIYVKRPRKGIV